MAWNDVLMDKGFHLGSGMRCGCASGDIERSDIRFEFLDTPGALAMGWNTSMGVKETFLCSTESSGVANPTQA
jgi:hypothetical protein